MCEGEIRCRCVCMIGFVDKRVKGIGSVTIFSWDELRGC